MIFMKMFSWWLLNYKFLQSRLCWSRRWCTGRRVFIKECNLGENKNSWNNTFHIDVKCFALLYTPWANRKNNVISSQSTLLWKDWDIFYLWRKDIHLNLKNVVLARFSFPRIFKGKKKYQPHSLNTAIGLLCKWATTMWKHF